VGNLHGRYPVPKRLDLSVLRQIREAIDVNLSLHGGSGTPGRYFQVAAWIGVSKVNFNSDLRYAYRTSLERQLHEHPYEYALVKLIGPVIRAVQDVVETRIDLLGATGKARP
jgi:fructose/tagatose bisphosphate aldolase